MSIYMRFDEETLKGIAGITQAEYFHAASARGSEEDLRGAQYQVRARAQGNRDHRAVRRARPRCWRWRRRRFRCCGSTGSSEQLAPLRPSPLPSPCDHFCRNRQNAAAPTQHRPTNGISEMKAQITALMRHRVTAKRQTKILAMRSEVGGAARRFSEPAAIVG